MSEPTPNRSGLWIDAVVYTAVLVGLLVGEWEFSWLTLEEASGLGVVLSIYAVSRTASRQPYGPLSASAVYILSLCIFHLGLTTAFFLGLEPTAHIEQSTEGWFDSYAMEPALYYTLLGIAGCSLGTTIAALAPDLPLPPIPQDEPADRALSVIGATLTATMSLAWIGVVLVRGGPGAFFGSYASLIELTEGSRLSTAFLLLSVGLPLLASTKWRWYHAHAYAAFSLFAVLSMSAGARGKAMFPIAIIGIVLARKGLRVKLRSVLLGGLVLLAFVSLIRDVRTVGVARVGQAAELSANPLEGMMEMGTSIRPVVEVVRWYDEGDDLLMGGSYWATIDRPLRRILPWRERIPAEEDMRIMNVLVMERGAGAIGFSPIAEAFRNFGKWGVILVMALTGLIIGTLDRLPNSGAWPAMVGVLAMPLLTQVRNSFQHVPFSSIVGVTIILGTVYVVARRGPRHAAARPNAAGANSAR